MDDYEGFWRSFGYGVDYRYGDGDYFGTGLGGGFGDGEPEGVEDLDESLEDYREG